MSCTCKKINPAPKHLIPGHRVLCRNGKWADVIHMEDGRLILWFGADTPWRNVDNYLHSSWTFYVEGADAADWDLMAIFGWPKGGTDIPLAAGAGDRQLLWERVKTLTKAEIEELLGFEIEIVD